MATMQMVSDFCDNYAIEVYIDCDEHGRTRAPLYAGQIASHFGVLDHCPVRLVGRDFVQELGLYYMAASIGLTEERGIHVWIMRKDPQGNSQYKAVPRSAPYVVGLPANPAVLHGIPDPDNAPDWGADDFWVRTTDSIVADVANHRKMLDEKVKRLRKELTDAEKELDVFVNWVCGTANGG
jgi:hypothetical protein